MKHIKVYGPGCKRCEGAETMIRNRARELDVEVEIEKVTDYAQIAMAGVLSTPGISVDGTLVHSGGLPRSGEIDSWLQD